MIQQDFEKLELAEVATILDRLNPLFQGSVFDPVETTVLGATLPFYPGHRLLEISDHTVSPPLQRFVLYGQDSAIVLDFTNAPIYALNKELPLQLNAETVFDYARFFFTYVKGRHGRFLISEGVDDINWKEEPPPAARKAIGKMLRPLALKTQDSDGSFLMEATVMFKNSLFKSDIRISADGSVSLSNEELLIEDMPVLDDVFGQ